MQVRGRLNEDDLLEAVKQDPWDDGAMSEVMDYLELNKNFQAPKFGEMGCLEASTN